MKDKLLHTPDGVRDVYNEECAKKLALQNSLLGVLHSYGYRDIETPTFEFFDVFSQEVGTVSSKDLFKFFDREGNTLVLRPDITPSIARAASKYFTGEDMPVRLCYEGSTFINNSSYQGRLKESTQLGAELIGDSSIDADAELVAMVVDTLLKAGLKEFQISVGQADFFKSLLEEAGVEEETEAKLKQLISNKNYFGVEELLDGLNISEGLKMLFTGLPQMFGSAEVLDQATSMTENERALQALGRLRGLYEILEGYGFEKYISFDLGMLSNYMYYTGIIFRAYTFGTGDAIVKGGRYDHLLEHFGKPAPSIGFVVVLNQLQNALNRQKIEIPLEDEQLMLLYEAKSRKRAILEAQNLRDEGMNVTLICMDPAKKQEDYLALARRKGIRMVYRSRGEEGIELLIKEEAGGSKP